MIWLTWRRLSCLFSVCLLVWFFKLRRLWVMSVQHIQQKNISFGYIANNHDITCGHFMAGWLKCLCLGWNSSKRDAFIKITFCYLSLHQASRPCPSLIDWLTMWNTNVHYTPLLRFQRQISGSTTSEQICPHSVCDHNGKQWMSHLL